MLTTLKVPLFSNYSCGILQHDVEVKKRVPHTSVDANSTNSWVDLDAKRLEPWFQLSSDGGATAENSLILQYPFDFLPFILLTVLRRK
jgi:hypothetical protein